jgi:hypothetical protein
MLQDYLMHLYVMDYFEQFMMFVLNSNDMVDMVENIYVCTT